MWDNYFKRNASARPADPSLGRMYDAQQAGPRGLMSGGHAGTSPAGGGLFSGIASAAAKAANTAAQAATRAATAPKMPKWKLEADAGYNWAGTTMGGQKPPGAFDSNDAFRERAVTAPPPRATGLMAAPSNQGAVPKWSPEEYQREAMEGLRAHVARLRDEQDPYGAGSTALRNYATQTDWFAQQTDQQREAAARAFGGPMVTAQDLSNMDSTGRAALVSGLAGIEAQRTANSAAWKQGRDNQVAGLYGQMLGAAGDPYRLEGLTHDNTYARLRNDGAQHDNTYARLRNDGAQQDVTQRAATMQSEIQKAVASGRIQQAEADAAQQIIAQGGEWWNHPWIKNLARAGLIGGGAVAGLMLGGPAGALYGAGAGASAAGGIQ